MGEAKRRTMFVAEIDATELTLRIAEAACDFRRPPGRDAASVLAELRASDPETTAGFDRIAKAASAYLAECIRRGSRPS
jgi:hypothetical protein